MSDSYMDYGNHFKLFCGELRKISIHVELCRYFSPNDQKSRELEQHLTVNDKGRVWFSAYAYEDLEYKKIRKESFSVDKKGIRFLFDLLEEFFSKKREIPHILDGDICNIELTNSDGEVFTYPWYLGNWYMVDNYSLSDVLREVTGMLDLYGFDGNARFHIIDRITLDFTRVKKFLPDNLMNGITPDLVTWKYKEQIVIDRPKHSLSQFVVIGSGCKIAHEYDIEGAIDSLLDGFDGDTLFRILPETPDNVINNPDDISLYRLTINYRNKEKYEVEGVFDQYGLPVDYDNFVSSILKCIGFYNFGLGETLLKINYGKKRRCEGQYIYLSCIFEENGKPYFYRTEDDTIDINDFLLVEAGEDDHKAIVKVVGVEYYDKNNVPLPINKTRSVIRKATESDFEKDF